MKMRNFFSKIILIFISILNEATPYLVIPFKTFKNPQSKQSINIAEDFLRYSLNNTIYIEIEAGLPTQKIPALILSEEFGFFIINHKCLIPSSFDTIEKSTTFSKSELYKDYTYKFRTQTDMIFGNDIFKFPTDTSSRKQATLNFMYSPNSKKSSSIREENSDMHFADDENHDYTCAGIGIRGAQYLGKDYEKNLVKQLFNENVINNNLFSIIYSTDSNDEGIFLVGAEPHEYNKNNFFEPQLRHISTVDNNFFVFWSLHPNKIYFSKENKEYNLTSNLLCTLEYNLGVIYGTDDYLNLIREHFFKDLILQRKCYEETVHSIYTVFYCDNKNDIETFPSLKLYIQQLLYTFNLDYNDLFEEKNRKYFFKIIFDRNNKIQWKLGKPFLKKYVFVYDYESNTIGFYNEQLPGGKKKKKVDSIFINILFVIIIIGFGYVGFYYGKKVYDKARKKRVNEIEDGYTYKTSKERNTSNTNLEMMIKFKILDE